jgi:hypothetical protein
VLRGETETTQENIQDWLQLDEGDWISASCLFVVFKSRLNSDTFIFTSTTYIAKYSIYLLSAFLFLPLRLFFASLIRIIA